jgi:uncharacterized membrane protein required for colicin V production
MSFMLSVNSFIGSAMLPGKLNQIIKAIIKHTVPEMLIQNMDVFAVFSATLLFCCIACMFSNIISVISVCIIFFKAESEGNCMKV